MPKLACVGKMPSAPNNTTSIPNKLTMKKLKLGCQKSSSENIFASFASGEGGRRGLIAKTFAAIRHAKKI